VYRGCLGVPRLERPSSALNQPPWAATVSRQDCACAHEGAPFTGPVHPHSGIATLTYAMEGAVSFIDPNNVKGTLPAGAVEWMQAGRGMWHGGGLDKAGRTRGFQLWIALPPELELGPTVSIYQAPGRGAGRRSGAGPPWQLRVRIERPRVPPRRSITSRYA
jgi:hypothetical protein